MYSQAVRFNERLKRVTLAVVLSVLCIFLYAGRGFVGTSFAATQDETIIGTMSIVLDNSQEPDLPVPDPDNPNPNPGDGDNGNSGDNADGADNPNNNEDVLKASALNKNSSNKDLLASTGDVFATTFVAILALATVLITCSYVSRRRLVTNEGGSCSQAGNKIKSAVLVLLAIVLLFGTIFTGFKAFADGEVTDDPTSNTATLTSKVVINRDGKIKSTDLKIKNNLKTGVTVKSISAPTEVSTWTANIDANAVIDAEGSVGRDWTPDSDTIPAELLAKLNNGEEVNLEFSSEVSYTAFNVTWNTNGGQGIITTAPVPENGNVVLPATNPTYDHYTFEGWNTQADGQGDEVNEDTVVTADITYYAKWTPDTYSIDFQFPNGGDFAGGVTPEKSYTYGVGIDSFEEPYKQGYDFDGWYDATSGGNKVASISTTDFGDKVLYARWTPSNHTQYKVQHIRESLEKDGSYGLYDAINDIVYEYGTTGEKTNAQPKTYVGFVVSEIGQETIKADGSTFVNIKYDRIPYTVTFDKNGIGNSTLSPITVKYQRKLRKPNVGWTVPGYTFGGWYSSQDCSGSEFDYANTSITKDITLYAKWTPITYTVKFDKNDTAATGTMVDQTFTYDTYQTLRTNTFTKADSTFAGWAETPTGEVKYSDAQSVKNFATTQGASVTLYAKWEETKYTITFDASGGSNANIKGNCLVGDDQKPVTSFSLEVGSGKTIPDTFTLDSGTVNLKTGPTAINGDDYANDTLHFYDWYTEPNGGGTKIKIGEATATEDATYYAFYERVTFLVTDSLNATNPVTLTGKRSLSEIKAVAEDIAKNGAGGIDYNTFTAAMNNDIWHLFTLLKDADGNFLDADDADSWCEFRIVHVGQHDNDGSGLTFQMVHALPGYYPYDSNSTDNQSNWAKSTIRPLLQSGGSIFNQFDNRLTSLIKVIPRKYNTVAGQMLNSTILTTNDSFTLLSYTEYIKSPLVQDWTPDLVGSTVSFWSRFNISDITIGYSIDELKNLCRTRSKLDSATLSCMRNVSANSVGASVIRTNGTIYSNAVNLTGSSSKGGFYVSLAFAL